LHIARTRLASQYPPHPAKDCAILESSNTNAIEATMTMFRGRFMRTGFVITASSSIHVNINCSGGKPCGKIQALFGRRGED
jgi:hypothetical protein